MGADEGNMVGARRRRRGEGLTTFKLKMIAGVLVALSVAGSTVVPAWSGGGASSMSSLTTVVVCEALSWMAIPIYAWLLVAGYRHTSSVPKYAIRLAALAVISEVPYDLATSGKVFDMTSQNPVFGLLVALIVLVLFDWAKAHLSGASRWVFCVAMALVGLLWDVLLRVGVRQRVMLEGAVTLGFVLIFALMASRENAMMFTAGLFGAVMLIAPGLGVAFVHYDNGKLGYRHSWTKWIWYVAYPLLLLIGYAVACATS